MPSTLTSFPAGVSSFGMPMIGTGGYLTTGTVLFVSSVSGADVNGRGSSDRPFATAKFAYTKCVAARGDMVICMPGHVESIAVGHTIPIGVTVIGIGTGAYRPTFNFTANVTLTLNTSVVLSNLAFDGSGAGGAVTAMFTTGGSGVQFYSVKVIGNGAVNGATSIISVGHDELLLSGCDFSSTAAGTMPAQAVLTTGVCTRVRILDSVITGVFSVATIKAANANGLKELLITRCTLRNIGTAVPAVLSLGTGSTGTISWTTLFSANTAATVTTIVGSPAAVNLAWFQVFGLTAGANANLNGILAPAAAAALP